MAVAITPDNKFAYVVTAIAFDNPEFRLRVLDLTTRQISTTIPLPKYSEPSRTLS